MHNLNGEVSMARQSAAAKTNELLEQLIAMHIESKTTSESHEKELINMAINPLENIETVDKKKIVLDARIGYMIIASVIFAIYTGTSVYNNLTNDISKLKDTVNSIPKIEAVETSQDKQITIITSKQEEMLSKINDISDDTKRLNLQVSAALTKTQR